MPLPAVPSRILSAAGTPPRHPSSPPLKLPRRAPLIGALCVISLGAFSAFAYRSVYAQPLRHLHFLGPKVITQPATRGLHSTRMEEAITTVPSIVVYVTVPNKEAGVKLAESIIKEKLAACVNRVPGIESVYWWDGKVQTDSEELLIIKTRESLLGALTEHVKANHEYDVPEVISLPITGGNPKYLDWLRSSTREG